MTTTTEIYHDDLGRTSHLLVDAAGKVYIEWFHPNFIMRPCPSRDQAHDLLTSAGFRRAA